MGTLGKTSLAVLCALLSGAISLAGQTSFPLSPKPTPEASKPAKEAEDANYPEHASLSGSRYVNQYFDFSFDLPADLHLDQIPRPVSRDGGLQLLDLGGPPPADAEIEIFAIPTATGKNQDAKAYMRNALDQELYRGVEELRGLTKANFGGHQFFLFETRRGIEQHVLLATAMGDYLLEIVLAAHDEKTVKRLESSFEHLTFFSAAEERQYLQADAKPYDGPAVSSHRLAVIEADPPVAHIDPGKISGDFYENAAIGFSYRIPQGWTLEAEGAVQPAIERYRAKEDFGRPRVGRAERRLIDACSRTLFSAWAKRPGADGQISYDEFGEVTVSAISLACFPSLKFPEKATDREAFKEFLLEFGLTHPIVSDMRDGKVFSAGSNVFLFLHGTVGFQIPDDELSRRLSIAMAITQRRGYLLTWFFAAPHDSELQALTDERVSFDAGLPGKEANASTPGGGTSAAAPPLANIVPSASGAAADAPASARSAPAQPPAAPTSEEQTAPASPAPSLLRPGESMQSQQGKGATIQNRKPSD